MTKSHLHQSKPIQTLAAFLTENGGRVTPPQPNPIIAPRRGFFWGNGSNAGNPNVRVVGW